MLLCLHCSSYSKTGLCLFLLAVFFAHLRAFYSWGHQATSRKRETISTVHAGWGWEWRLTRTSPTSTARLSCVSLPPSTTGACRQSTRRLPMPSPCTVHVAQKEESLSSTSCVSSCISLLTFKRLSRHIERYEKREGTLRSGQETRYAFSFETAPLKKPTPMRRQTDRRTDRRTDRQTLGDTRREMGKCIITGCRIFSGHARSLAFEDSPFTYPFDSESRWGKHDDCHEALMIFRSSAHESPSDTEVE